MKEILTASLIGLVFTITVSILKSEYYSKEQKYILGFLLLFAPLQWVLAILFRIYNNNTEKLGIYKQSNFDKVNNKLYELRERNIISKKEYEEKIKKNKKNILEKKIESTKEYRNLKSLKNDGIITDLEFKEKIKLVKKIYSSKIQTEKNETQKKKKKKKKNKIRRKNKIDVEIDTEKSINKFKINIQSKQMSKEIEKLLKSETIELKHILKNSEIYSEYYASFDFVFYLALELDNRKEITEKEIDELQRLSKKYYNTNLNNVLKKI
jgi:hypothetical protein